MRNEGSDLCVLFSVHPGTESPTSPCYSDIQETDLVSRLFVSGELDLWVLIIEVLVKLLQFLIPMWPRNKIYASSIYLIHMVGFLGPTPVSLSLKPLHVDISHYR